LSFKVYTVICI